jgi:hypothetical protein
MSDTVIKLLAQWISNKGMHFEGDPNLSTFDSLDDLLSEVYNQNRIKVGFMQANEMAFEAVIRKVLEIDQQIDKILQ